MVLQTIKKSNIERLHAPLIELSLMSLKSGQRVNVLKAHNQ